MLLRVFSYKNELTTSIRILQKYHVNKCVKIVLYRGLFSHFAYFLSS